MRVMLLLTGGKNVFWSFARGEKLYFFGENNVENICAVKIKNIVT